MASQSFYIYRQKRTNVSRGELNVLIQGKLTHVEFSVKVFTWKAQARAAMLPSLPFLLEPSPQLPYPSNQIVESK